VFALGRNFRDGSVGAAISLALILCASPLAAQKTILTLTGATITFNAPTAADYIAGYIDSPTGVTFTLNAQNGGNRTVTAWVRSTSASLGGGKAIGELQWRRSDLAVWNSMTLTDVQVQQQVMAKGSANDPWSNTIFFRMLLNWTTDPPGTYSGDYQVTLSQTVP
jgi:hypothetical protein